MKNCYHQINNIISADWKQLQKLGLQFRRIGSINVTRDVYTKVVMNYRKQKEAWCMAKQKHVNN